MTTTPRTWRAERVGAAGADLEIVKGGAGTPLLLLHDELGHPGWLRFHEALAARHALHIPSHPGFGGSPRLDWIMSVRDLAGFYLAALEDLGLDPVDVIGFSFGGWLAATMASMCPHAFKRLVLVAPMGIRPREGEIYDMFVVTAREFIAASFHDPENTPEYAQLYGGAEPTPEQREALEVAREESCRLTWRPYMHDPSLPYLLRRKMPPTLVVWGREDAIVPVNAGEIYRDAIPGARLVVLDGCGHRPEIERPEEFLRLLEEFLQEGA